MGQTVNYDSRYGAMLKKDLDSNLKPLLDETKGGRFRKYTDWRSISGESRVIPFEDEGDYTSEAPFLTGRTELNAFDKEMTGNDLVKEIVPKVKYGYDILTYEQTRAFGGRLKGDEPTFKKLQKALTIAEDVTIMEALEEAEALMPDINKFGDPTKVGYDPQNIELLKRNLILASTRFDGMASVMAVGAFMVIDNIDWSAIFAYGTQNNIFASSDYQTFTGIDGRSVTRVFGVAVERTNYFRKAKNGGKRTYYVPKGTARICTIENIHGADWSDLRTEVTSQMSDGDTTKIVVGKSMGAKVGQPECTWKFTFKSEEPNVVTDVARGSDKNPIITKAKD